MTKKHYILMLIVLALAAAVAGILLAGCSTGPALAFSRAEISVFVGDERDMALYMTFVPATTDDRSFTLESDSACVEVRGTKIKGIAPGEAVVTASNGGHTASIKVKVDYRAAQSLALETDGNTVQTVGDIEPITFNAYLDDYSNPEIEIVWSVNGERKDTGGEYVFEPNGVGEFSVAASAAGLMATENVAVYSPTEAEGHSDGALEQYRDFSPVRFYVEEQRDYKNPLSVYRWTVNGETKSVLPELNFAPLSLGTYEVELFVNGVKRNIDGAESAVIIANGDRAPNGRVEFDDMGGVFVVWNDFATASSVSVTDYNGERKVYNSSDSRYAQLFGKGYFDASEYITPCSNEPRVFTVTVTADAMGEPFAFTQYPQEAEKYITEKVLCRNSFITSQSSAADWIHELYAVGTRKADCYLSREAAADKDGIKAAASAAAEQLGITAIISIEGNIMSAELGVFVNSPTLTDTVSVRPSRITIPHFEMTDSRSLRSSDYRLAIMRAEHSVSVINTEQLLIAVELGIRPIPVAESRAWRVYSSAQTILMSIIGRSYTDSQKVHAIYDWLQLCTQRVEKAKPESVSNFLEGVFGDGGATPALLISDVGAAKATALLCGMEGIACEIVYDDGNYYNRVELGGLWYNVDVYDGEALIEIDGTKYEFATHAGLFFADGTSDVAGAAYDTSLSYYLQKRTAGGVYYDRYVETDDQDESVLAAVTDAMSRQSITNLKVKLPNGTMQYTNNYYVAEFLLADDLSEAVQEAAKALMKKAAVEYIEQYVRDNYKDDSVEQIIESYVKRIRIDDVDGVVLVTAQIPSFPSTGR